MRDGQPPARTSGSLRFNPADPRERERRSRLRRNRALATALLAFGGGLVFARFLERWL